VVKNIRATLDENDYEEMNRIKGRKTWVFVLRRGIESLEVYPKDEEWKKQIENKKGMEVKR